MGCFDMPVWQDDGCFVGKWIRAMCCFRYTGWNSGIFAGPAGSRSSRARGSMLERMKLPGISMGFGE